MAMAYGGTAKVSDAAKRVIGPDDPKARAEVEEKRDQEFGTMDQIGMAADMLPGGAIAAGGAKAVAAGGRNIYKMINDSIKGFKVGGDKSAKDAVLNWASSTDLSLLEKLLMMFIISFLRLKVAFPWELSLQVALIQVLLLGMFRTCKLKLKFLKLLKKLWQLRIFLHRLGCAEICLRLLVGIELINLD